MKTKTSFKYISQIKYLKFSLKNPRSYIVWALRAFLYQSYPLSPENSDPLHEEESLIKKNNHRPQLTLQSESEGKPKPLNGYSRTIYNFG